MSDPLDVDRDLVVKVYDLDHWAYWFALALLAGFAVWPYVAVIPTLEELVRVQDVELAAKKPEPMVFICPDGSVWGPKRPVRTRSGSGRK